MCLAQELGQRGKCHIVAKQYATFGAVVGDALGVRGKFQEGLAEPEIGRIGVEPLLQVRIEDADEDRIQVLLADDVEQLPVVLRVHVRRVRVVGEVHPGHRHLLLLEHGVRHHPAGGADVAAGVDARQPVAPEQFGGHAVGQVRIVEHRIPPVDLHPRRKHAIDDRL